MEVSELEAMAKAIVDSNSYMTLDLAALAEKVTDDDEIARGMSVFSERSVAQGARAWTLDDVGPSGGVRLYRARAVEQFVLSPEDERLPLTLE